MNNRFHSKYHRHNHHTYTDPTIPDAGHDPIASPESPFLGDFCIAGSLSAISPLSSYAVSFTGPGTALKVEALDSVEDGGVALQAIGNSALYGDVYITGNLYGPYIPELYGKTGKSYTFSGGTTSISNNNVTLNLDLSTLYINSAGQLAVNIGQLGSILNSKYNFSGGLIETSLPSDTFVRSNVSVNVDNSSICLNSNGQLSLSRFYVPGPGINHNTLTKELSVNVDNSSIKIINNKLQLGYDFVSTNSGLVRDVSNNIKVNTDSSTLKIIGNTLTSGFNFTSGVLLNTTGAKQEVILNVDGNSLGISSTNRLEALNVLKTNATAPQNVNSLVNFKKLISVGSDGIKFADGSILTSGYIGSKVQGLAKLSTNNSSGVAWTSTKSVLGWGTNEYFFKTLNLNAALWPPQPILFENSYNLSNNITISDVQHSYEGTTTLLSDGSLWSQGFPVIGYKPSTGSTSPDMVFKQISFPTLASTPVISKFEVHSSGQNYGQYSADAYISPSRSCVALTNDGKIFLFGNFRNHLKTPSAPYSLIEGTSELQYTPVQLSAVPLGASTQNSLTPTLGFQDVKLIKIASMSSATDEGIYGTIILALKDNVLYTCGYDDPTAADKSLGSAIINNTLFNRGATGPTNVITNYWYRLMPVLTGVKKIISNPYNYKTTYVIKTDGTVWACGRGVTMNPTLPTFVQLFPLQLTNITDMVVMRSPFVESRESFCAIDSVGTAKVWGYNGDGHLGSSSIGSSISTPTALTGIPAVTKMFYNVIFGKQSSTDTESSVATKSIRILALLCSDGLAYVAGKCFSEWFTNAPSTSFNPLPIANVADISFSTSVGPNNIVANKWAVATSPDNQVFNSIFVRDVFGRLFTLNRDAIYSLTGTGIGNINQPKYTNASPIEISAWL